MIVRKAHANARRLIARVGRAFTLVETLVAIAAVSVITVAIAGVFAAVGDTVTQGRSVSRFTTYASRLERQLRDDISNMTRDGFFVIRHELVGDRDPEFTAADRRDPVKGVALSAEDPRPRPRRADEMVFFRKGTFTSQRQPVVPGLTPSADAARIYYGHGIRFPEDILDRSGKNAFQQPQPGHVGFAVDNGDSVLGQLRLGGWVDAAPSERDGPNANASDWTLLRHVTALSRPGVVNSTQQRAGVAAEASQLLPGDAAVYDEMDPDGFQLGDREYQLSGQPAAADVFGTISQLYWRADTPVPADLNVRPGAGHFRPAVLGTNSGFPRGGDNLGTTDAQPFTASGTVDLATTDLESIRAMVLRADRSPIELFSDISRFSPESIYDPAGGILQSRIALGPLPTAYRMQSWMRDAFPTNQLYAMKEGRIQANEPTPLEERRTRVRYEDTAPGFFNVLNDGFGENSVQVTINGSYKEAYRNALLADRQMLSASIFAPGVSEFIVEWSFGQVKDRTSSDPNAGELIWYGLARRGDADFDGVPDEWLVRAYDTERHNDQTARLFPYADVLAVNQPLRSQVIHGRAQTFSNNGSQIRYSHRFEESLVLYSYFGYVDPIIAGTPSAGEPPTVPWPWPKLVRVTMTLSDPSDPQIQETFQFVFRVPEQ